MNGILYKTRFKTQLYAYSFLLITLIALLIVPVLYIVLWNNYRSQIGETLQIQANQIAINIDSKLDYFALYAKMLLSNDQLLQSLERDTYPAAEQTLALNAQQFLALNAGRVNALRLHRNNIYDESSNWAIKNHSIDRFKLSTGTAMTNQLWTGSYLNNRNERVFSLFQKVYQMNPEREYFVEMRVYETELYILFNEDKSGNQIMILNNGNLMTTSNREFMRHIGRLQEMPMEPPDESDRNTLCMHTRCRAGWDIYIAADMGSIQKSFFRTYFAMFSIIIFAFLLACLLISVGSARLDKRMGILRAKIDLLSQWELVQDLPMDGGDEFKMLADALDDTRQRILSLVDHMNDTNELKRSAEISALRSQINSHFLFNSLSSIKYLSKQEDKRLLAYAVDKLSLFLRYSLSHDENDVPLSREMEQLSAYVYLQKLRYDDELNVHIDVDDELLCCKTVKLILQPLVENAIYHGRREDGSWLNITIYTYFDEQDYYIVVEDDGNGMTQERIRSLQEPDDQPGDRPETGGYGLRNVIRRIRLCSDGRAELHIESKTGSFTKIVIRQRR